MRAGADDVLGHPFDRLELLSRVKSLLRIRLHARDVVGPEETVRSLGLALVARDRETSLSLRLLSFVLTRRVDDGATVVQRP